MTKIKIIKNDDLIDVMWWDNDIGKWVISDEDFNDIPTVDAVLVRHGHWTKDGCCSECGTLIPTDDRVDCIFRDEVMFCYNCGADMRGDRE